MTVPVGGDLIDETFLKLLGQKYPQARLSLNMAREIKEKYGFVHDVNEKAVVTLPVQGRLKQFDVTATLKESCKTIVGPIVQGLREMIARFDPEFQQRMLHNIVLGGGGSQLKGLDVLIEESLKEYGGGKVRKVGDAVFAGAVGALKLALGMPHECWDNLKAPVAPVSAGAHHTVPARVAA
jgi:rod shape-determining protein MreB